MIVCTRIIIDLLKSVSWRKVVPSIIAFGLLSMLFDKVVDTDALDQPIHLFLSLCEECIELGMPVLIIIALLQWRSESHYGETEATE